MSSIHYVTLGRLPNPHKAWGYLHNWIGGSQQIATKALPLKNLHNLIGVPKNTTKTPQRPLSRLGSKDPRGTSSGNKLPKWYTHQLFTSTYHHGELTPMHQMQWQEHHKDVKSFSLKFQQSYKSYWGNKRGRTKRRTQNSPRSRSRGFPSQREGFDWWKCRSRSPLSFPSKICKNHGGIEEIGNWRGSRMDVKNVLKNLPKRVGNRWGRRPLK